MSLYLLKIRKEHKILIQTQCSKTFADSHNRSKNERTFCPEIFGPPLIAKILRAIISEVFSVCMHSNRKRVGSA
jgi:hypothetical protein